jgi:uncharacterized protein YuzE
MQTQEPMQTQEYEIEIDEEADAAYIRVRGTPVARTDEMADGVLLDFDATDEIVGVEVLGLRDRVGVRHKISYLNGLVAGLLLRPATAAAE